VSIFFLRAFTTKGVRSGMLMISWRMAKVSIRKSGEDRLPINNKVPEVRKNIPTGFRAVDAIINNTIQATKSQMNV
jgi:hypothetical protein